MSQRQQEFVTQSSGSPAHEDRFTVVLSAHYLEWDTGNATDLRWAYDRRHPTGNGTCYQSTIRVDPGVRKPLVLPDLELGNCELMLGHKLPKFVGDPNSPGILQEQQRANVIEVWDAEKVIGTIGPDRMMFGQFKGPLFVTTSRATALLLVTAAPL